MASSESIIRFNLREFDFVEYHKGWITERFRDVADRKFCFVHLDVDLYEPALGSLDFFYERIVPGSIIICDDYGFITCAGARRAMDEFFERRRESVISLLTGQGFVIVRSGTPKK